MFPKIGVPQNGWWKYWKHLIQNGWFGVKKNPYFRKHPCPEHFSHFLPFCGFLHFVEESKGILHQSLHPHGDASRSEWFHWIPFQTRGKQQVGEVMMRALLGEGSHFDDLAKFFFVGRWRICWQNGQSCIYSLIHPCIHSFVGSFVRSFFLRRVKHGLKAHQGETLSWHGQVVCV